MRLHCEHLWRLAVFFRGLVLGATTLQLLFYHPQLLCNYFRNRQNYLGPKTQVFACVCGGGVLAARSQESCLRHSQLWSRHSQPQSAYLSAVRACDHVNTPNATAKCQMARGFDVHTTHCQHIFQENTDFTKNPGFSSKYCILMVLRFSHISHVFFGLHIADPVDAKQL